MLGEGSGWDPRVRPAVPAAPAALAASGNLEIVKSGNLEIWKSGTWKSGSLGPPQIKKKIEKYSNQNPCRPKMSARSG